MREGALLTLDTEYQGCHLRHGKHTASYGPYLEERHESAEFPLSLPSAQCSLGGLSWSLNGCRGKNTMYVPQCLLTPCRLRLASLEQVSSSFTTLTRESIITKHNAVAQVRASSCPYLLKCLLHIFNHLVTAVYVFFWIVCFIICSPVISIVRIICKHGHITSGHGTWHCSVL